MKPIEKYIEAMENKDFAGLADLFTKDGILCDYCSNSSNQREYHIYGKEAINMFFRNKFGFRQYSIIGAEVVNKEQAEFIANYWWLSYHGNRLPSVKQIRRLHQKTDCSP